MFVVVGTRTSNKSVWAYNDDGTALWSYDTGANTNSCKIYGNYIYVVGAVSASKNCWKLDSLGNLVASTYVYSSAVAWDIDVDANFVYVSCNGACVRLSKDLSTATNIITSGANSFASILVDGDGNIYCGSGGTPLNLYKYSSALVQQWTKDPETSATFNSLALLSTGDIVAHSATKIYRFPSDGGDAGSGDWSYTYASTTPMTSLAVDSDDNIYAINQGTTPIIKLSSAGALLDSITSSKNFYGVCLDGDETVFATGGVDASYNCWEVDFTGAGSFTNLFNSGGQTAGISWADIIVTDLRYTRKLVAIANNEVWYESAPGTMTELSDANGDINSIFSLDATEAYQKIFIVNRTNKKVIDFINTKLSSNDAGAVACTPGMTLTGGTSTASMIVDFADADTDDSPLNVYGYRTTAVAFSSGETVTGTNSGGGTVSFVLSAAEDAPPHWYDWTPFCNNSTTYGTLLTRPTLICLYRGRLVIAGDKEIPHAWQMTKVGNPWKVLYDFTNDGDLSAVTYSNNLVGHLGDIITALIPYKDDLLIFGCSQSIWVLVGDPLGSGQLAEVTHSTGIYGYKSWCIDNKKNLYFLGSDGIYRMPISETSSPPENISKDRLPNLISDLDLDQSLHRVVLSFDPVENGIIISKTKLSDGSNTNYFYSLLTGGFFPETYPDSCGVFSSHYYHATDSTYKKFLMGGYDGYIREFDNSTKNDTTTSSTSAISSYCTILQKLSETEFQDSVLREISGILSGGASSGDFSDSDGVTWALYKGNDAETILEDVKDAATAFASGTWSTVGKQNKARPRMRGTYAGLKLYNSTASQTWSVEKVYGEVIPKGRK